MIHFGHMLLFSGLLAFFFAFLLARPGRRFRYALTLWGIMAVGALAVSLIMYPFT